VCNPPKDQGISKDDTTSYQQLKKIFEMAYCNRLFDTQTNESLNTAIATVAPKHTCYSGMISLFGHITVIIGMHNLGYVTYFHLLFRELGMELTRILFDFLKDKEERKEFRRTYKKRLNMKAV
jgi:hypothetical protein